MLWTIFMLKFSPSIFGDDPDKRTRHGIDVFEKTEDELREARDLLKSHEGCWMAFPAAADRSAIARKSDGHSTGDPGCAEEFSDESRSLNSIDDSKITDLV